MSSAQRRNMTTPVQGPTLRVVVVGAAPAQLRNGGDGAELAMLSSAARPTPRRRQEDCVRVNGGGHLERVAMHKLDAIRNAVHLCIVARHVQLPLIDVARNHLQMLAASRWVTSYLHTVGATR